MFWERDVGGIFSPPPLSVILHHSRILFSSFFFEEEERVAVIRVEGLFRATRLGAEPVSTTANTLKH